MCMYLHENTKAITSTLLMGLDGLCRCWWNQVSDLVGLRGRGPLKTKSFLNYFYCFWGAGTVLLSNKSARRSPNASEHKSALICTKWIETTNNIKRYALLNQLRCAQLRYLKVIIHNSVANHFNFMPLIWNWWAMNLKRSSWRVTDTNRKFCQLISVWMCFNHNCESALNYDELVKKWYDYEQAGTASGLLTLTLSQTEPPVTSDPAPSWHYLPFPPTCPCVPVSPSSVRQWICGPISTLDFCRTV